jgi:hypothetical protein
MPSTGDRRGTGERGPFASNDPRPLEDSDVPATDQRRLVLIAFVAALAVMARPSATLAGCNLIPQSQPIFRGALGTLDRPFAGPGDFVELHVRPTICDRSSPGIGADPSNLVVTLLFTPSTGPRRAVVLTTQSCTDAALVQKLNACASTPGMGAGGVACVQVNQSGPFDADIVTRNDSIPRFRFRFPDTDAILGPDGDDRTLAGPATIAVSDAESSRSPWCSVTRSRSRGQSTPDGEGIHPGSDKQGLAKSSAVAQRRRAGFAISSDATCAFAMVEPDWVVASTESQGVDSSRTTKGGGRWCKAREALGGAAGLAVMPGYEREGAA